MIKTYQLIALEKAGIFYHATDGKWYIGCREDKDLTPYLLQAGMFEH